MNQETLRIQKISGHAGSVPGDDMQREYTVCKLIDTTTCIGCKACEVACMEWNDLPFGETVFDNTYQTMPETRWNYWNLILFNEHERDDGTLMWLMRKNKCMHCAEPVRHSKDESQDQPRVQVHAVRGSRGRRLGAGVYQVVSNGMLALRQQGRYEVPCGRTRQAASRSLQLPESWCV